MRIATIGTQKIATENPVFIISLLVILPVPYINAKAGIANGVKGDTAVDIAAIIASNLGSTPIELDNSIKTGTIIIVAEELFTKLDNNAEIITIIRNISILGKGIIRINNFDAKNDAEPVLIKI